MTFPKIDQRGWLAWWAQQQRRRRGRPSSAPTGGFPDYGVSADGYDMTGNELLLHFRGNLLDSSGKGRNVTPYNGGRWYGAPLPAGNPADIAFGRYKALGTVNFNWAGGSSETFIPSSKPNSTVIFWTKISYLTTMTNSPPDDAYDQPILCFCNVNNTAGFILRNGIPFGAVPARDAVNVTLTLAHGTTNSIVAWDIPKYEWVQIAIVSTGTFHQIFVNGYTVASATKNTFNSLEHFRIGGWYGDNQMSLSPYVELGELAVFSRALSGAEILDIYLKQNL